MTSYILYFLSLSHTSLSNASDLESLLQMNESGVYLYMLMVA